MVLPLMQVIAVFFAATGLAGAVGVAEGVGVGTGAACVKVTLTIGVENVKPYAAKRSQPSFSFTTVVATLFSPVSLTIEMLA